MGWSNVSIVGNAAPILIHRFNIQITKQNNKCFSSKIQNIFQEIPSTVVEGNVNVTPDENCIRQLCQKLSLLQWITEPTYNPGKNIDLIFTSSQTDSETAGFPLQYT